MKSVNHVNSVNRGGKEEEKEYVYNMYIYVYIYCGVSVDNGMLRCKISTNSQETKSKILMKMNQSMTIELLKVIHLLVKRDIIVNIQEHIPHGALHIIQTECRSQINPYKGCSD